MKKLMTSTIYVFAFLAAGLVACEKDFIEEPIPTPTPEKPGEAPTESVLKLRVQARVTVGDIVYDSLPASFTINSWDANGIMHSKDTQLTAGAHQISLSKSHLSYKIKMSKWGESDELSITKDQVNENMTYLFEATVAAKKLRMKEDFTLIQGAYRPSGKAVYNYGANGHLNEVNYYQKLPQYSDLQLTVRDEYKYSGNQVTRINRFDGKNNGFGFTEFSYDANGKIINMHDKSYDQETFSSVEYSTGQGRSLITIDYLYNNGHALEYKMKFTGGNKIEDAATSSTGGGEGGTYQYDFNINPYAHMNMPTLYLANLSKNNLIGQQKGYGGSIPSAVPYKFEYVYDAQGYPVELIKSFKNFTTGAHLYTTKTVFTY